MTAVSLIVDEIRGKLGHAHEDADRVDLFEDKEGPAVVAAAGLEVIARADIALGDHAGEGALTRPYSTITLASRSLAWATSQIGAGGFDVDARVIAIGDRLVECRFHLRDHRIGLVARRHGFLELAVGLIANLVVQDSLL